MLKSLMNMIYNYFNPNPCSQCIVKAKCLNTPLFQRPSCNIRYDWSVQKNRAIMHIFYTVENIVFIVLLCMIAAIIVLTFGLGIWKWYDIWTIFYVKFF